MMHVHVGPRARRVLVGGLLALCLAWATGSQPGSALGLTEIGVRVSIDRLATLTSATGIWQANVRAYVRTALDDVWCMDMGLGFDFARMAPSATIGLRRGVLQDIVLEGDVTLAWIPRHGIVAALDTGVGYYPQISERGQLILETFPMHWQIVSVDHRYIPVPELRLSFALGANLLLEQSGYFGEVITVEGYKIENRRLPFSLFVGNGWYLTAARFTTLVGYEL